MTGNLNQPPEAWQNYSTRFPVPAFRIRRGDLKRLYGIINDKTIEYRDRVIATQMSQMSGESDEDFSSRRQRIFDAFVTSVTVTNLNGEMIPFNKEASFDSVNLPERIRSVFISTRSVHEAVLKFSHTCSIVLLLDFSRPPLLDLGRAPNLATQNESSFEISADIESWFTAVRSRLIDFFRERQTKNNWLHSTGIYDVLLFCLGIPAAIRLSYRLGDLITTSALPSIVKTSIYVYIFLLSIFAFRLAFSYSRWVFPKVEIDLDGNSSTLRHRGVWLAIFAGLISSLLYDVIKASL